MVYTEKTPALQEVLQLIGDRCIAQEFHHSEFFDFESFDYVIFFQGHHAYNKLLRDKIELMRSSANKVILADVTSAPQVVAYKLMERIQEAPTAPSVFGALQPTADYWIALTEGKEVSVQFEHLKPTLEEFAFRLKSDDPKPSALFELKLFNVTHSKLIFSQKVHSSEIRKDGYARVPLLNPYRKPGPLSLIASISCLSSDPKAEPVKVWATSKVVEYSLIEDRHRKSGSPAFYTR